MLLGQETWENPVRPAYGAYCRNLVRLRLMAWNLWLVSVDRKNSQQEEIGALRARMSRAVDEAFIHDPILKMGYEAMLELLVIGAWSALETLLQDIWVSILNESPIQGGGIKQVAQKYEHKFPKLAPVFGGTEFCAVLELNQIRNVLLHRGGIIDKRYIAKMAGLSDTAALVLGERVKIDAGEAIRFFNAVVHVGNAVILQVANSYKS